METKACERCGALFKYVGFGDEVCPLCAETVKREFESVKAYLNEHGAKNMYEISIATGVDQKVISRYLRQGRLEIPAGSDVFIKCEMCGAEIRSGRFCMKCGMRLRTEGKLTTFAEIGDDAPKIKGKMHFLDRNWNE